MLKEKTVHTTPTKTSSKDVPLESSKEKDYSLWKFILGGAVTLGIGSLLWPAEEPEPELIKEEDYIKQLAAIAQEYDDLLKQYLVNPLVKIPTTKKDAALLKQPQSMVGGRNADKKRFEIKVKDRILGYLDLGVVEDGLEICLFKNDSPLYFDALISGNLVDLTDALSHMLEDMELVDTPWHADKLADHIATELNKHMSVRQLKAIDEYPSDEFVLQSKATLQRIIVNDSDIRNLDANIWKYITPELKEFYITILPVVDPADGLLMNITADQYDVTAGMYLFEPSEIPTILRNSPFGYEDTDSIYNIIVSTMSHNLRSFTEGL